MKKITIFLTVLLLTLTGCGSPPVQPAESEPVQNNELWAEAAKLYCAFYENNLADNEEIYALSLLDLDVNGSPELILYMAGNPVSDAAAVFTLEDKNVCCFTELSGSILEELDLSPSQNALSQLLSANRFFAVPDTSNPIVQNDLTFRAFTEHTSGERVFLLHSRVADLSSERGTWYRFGSKDEKLYAEVLIQYERFFEGYHDEDQAGKNYIDGTEVGTEEYDAALAGQVERMMAEYDLDKSVDYAGTQSNATDWNAFFMRMADTE